MKHITSPAEYIASLLDPRELARALESCGGQSLSTATSPQTPEHVKEEEENWEHG